ncbi:TGACG-sequence-specific DNA-binding protein TGA-2.1-like protein [Drosera capensis]
MDSGRVKGSVVSDGNGSSLKTTSVMPSLVSPISVSVPIGTEGINTHSSRVSEFGAPEQPRFSMEDAVGLSRSRAFSSLKSAGAADLPFASFNKTQAQMPVKESQQNLVTVAVGPNENWADSNRGDASPRTDTSTDDNTEDKHPRKVVSSMLWQPPTPVTDLKRRIWTKKLAQNREAARKSRLRKKAYVQQLENSRLKLTQLEQELQRARQQGIFISSSGDQTQSTSGNGALAFDVEYSRWLEEHNKHINELRAAVNSHASDSELRTVVDSVTMHFDDIFRIKGTAAKADAFHILSGMWKTPAERCFMWIGGFRSSELLKILVNQLEPLTEQQLMGICNLQQSSQQAEDALSQGMEALQQSLAETLANGTPGQSGSSGNVANYMGQMAMAMGKLGTLEGFLRQADNLRQQTLQQMHRILTTRQSARALLAINDYFSRLRALSSLWLARPRE